MRVLVVGATGCVGRALVHALRARGQTVIAGSRGAGQSGAPSSSTMHVDYAQAVTPQAWAERLLHARIGAVVNCAGILMERDGQRFDRVHAHGPIELFEGAARAGVSRVVQVSALGAAEAGEPLPPYLASKHEADRALAALPIAHAVVRPSLVYGPGSSSAALFATLASLPLIALPGAGRQQVQPIHVYEVAEAIARWIESDVPRSGIFELAGPAPMSWREMLETYREAMDLGVALWLPLPMPLMRAGARLAEALPQQVFSRDTLRLLERGNTTAANVAPLWLRRAPSTLRVGLRVWPPRPALDLRVRLSPAVSWLLRLSVAGLWLVTAMISALLPHDSGVLNLLARCGFEGDAGTAMWIASCTLNTLLAVAVLHRPGAWTYALQIGAVLGYTFTAAWHMPELTIDHCGPLLKNLPLLALLFTLWLATPVRPRVGAGARAQRASAEAAPATPAATSAASALT
jgi:uncharacterized protein YbjT (DUF2867 family)